MDSTKYNQVFREAVVRKLLMRGNRTIADIAAELNVPYHKARSWLRSSKMANLRRPLSCDPMKSVSDIAEVHELKDDWVVLRREFRRKEKALSELAALLILQRQGQLRWGNGRHSDGTYRSGVDVW